MKQNYIPGSMSFIDSFSGPRGNVGFTMKYDNEKAKKIIKDLLTKGRKITSADVGLDGDWRENSDTLYDGEFQEVYFYNSSIWANPIMLVYFENEPSECYEVWERVDE